MQIIIHICSIYLAICLVFVVRELSIGHFGLYSIALLSFYRALAAVRGLIIWALQSWNCLSQLFVHLVHKVSAIIDFIFVFLPQSK